MLKSHVFLFSYFFYCFGGHFSPSTFCCSIHGPLRLHVVRPIHAAESPPLRQNYSLTLSSLPLASPHPPLSSGCALTERQQGRGDGTDKRWWWLKRGLNEGESCSGGRKEGGRMQRPPSMRDSIFLPFQNRTVSHQSLCLPLISQLRDLAPDKPLSA